VRDVVVLVTLVLAFATLVTAHVAIAARLVLTRRPRYRGVLALLVPPLAPIWGMREGLRRNAAIWIAALLVYVVALIAANR
jgi:hypothetical protein